MFLRVVGEYGPSRLGSTADDSQKMSKATLAVEMHLTIPRRRKQWKKRQ